LNIHQQLTGFELVSVGTLDAVSFHVRDVFRPAIVHSAASILIAHNHPSGNPAPSDMDIKTTRDLARAGQLLKIQLVDHVIIGRAGGRIFKQGFVSLLELGYWDN
jgi:DNA repair protein RadC